MKLILAEMSLKRASSCVSNVPKIKKICSDSSLEIARSSENAVTGSRTDEGVEGDSYILATLAVIFLILSCLCYPHMPICKVWICRLLFVCVYVEMNGLVASMAVEIHQNRFQK